MAIRFFYFFFLSLLLASNLAAQDSLKGPLGGSNTEIEDEWLDEDLPEQNSKSSKNDDQEDQEDPFEDEYDPIEEEEDKKERIERKKYRSKDYKKKYRRFHHRASTRHKVPLVFNFQYAIVKPDLPGLKESTGLNQFELQYYKKRHSEASFMAGINYSWSQQSGLEQKTLNLILGHQSQLNSSRQHKVMLSIQFLLCPYTSQKITADKISVKNETGFGLGSKIQLAYQFHFSRSQGLLFYAGYMAQYFGGFKNSSSQTGADSSVNYISKGPNVGAGIFFYF
jgi:hypothetical protein